MVVSTIFFHPEILRKIPIEHVLQVGGSTLEPPTRDRFQMSAQSCTNDAWKSKGAPRKKLPNKGANNKFS